MGCLNSQLPGEHTGLFLQFLWFLPYTYTLHRAPFISESCRVASLNPTYIFDYLFNSHFLQSSHHNQTGILLNPFYDPLMLTAFLTAMFPIKSINNALSLKSDSKICLALFALFTNALNSFEHPLSMAT